MSDLPPIHAYLLAEHPFYVSPLTGQPAVILDTVPGSVVVSIGTADLDGDIPVAFEDGRVESVSWQSLTPTSPGSAAASRADLMRECFWQSADESEAVERYASVLASMGRLRATAGKVCSRCGEYRLYVEFGNDASSGDGKAHRCLECDARRKRESRAV